VCSGSFLTAIGRAATLADIPDDFLISGSWVSTTSGSWASGQTGQAGPGGIPEPPRVAAGIPSDASLVFTERHQGSPFAVTGYTCIKLRSGGRPRQPEKASPEKKLKRSWWTLSQPPPPRIIPGEAAPRVLVQGAPPTGAGTHNYRQVETGRASLIWPMAGTPISPAGPITFQINYRHPRLKGSMAKSSSNWPEIADGVRCDMAMLILARDLPAHLGRAVFAHRQFPTVDEPFWPETIGRVKGKKPALFYGEVYWILEWTLMQQGFRLLL